LLTSSGLKKVCCTGPRLGTLLIAQDALGRGRSSRVKRERKGGASGGEEHASPRRAKQRPLKDKIEEKGTQGKRTRQREAGDRKKDSGALGATVSRVLTKSVSAGSGKNLKQKEMKANT